MDDAKARELFNKIVGHPQVNELIQNEITKQAKEFRKNAGEKIWDRAQRQLARQHGFDSVGELRNYLRTHGRPQREVSRG